MTDAYGGRDSRRTNSPAGHFRRELVRATKANELKLSGSPIQYFVDADYRNADHYITGTYKLGIAGLYDHTDTTWLDPSVVVSSVSTDGYTITLTAGVSVGDEVEVFYYATGTGWRDAETPSQAGDVLAPETFDALVQKLNDCPPLDWENNSPTMDYDISMCTYVVPVPAGMENTTTTVAKYSAAQVGTWQTTNTPFYVTAIHMGWSGATLSTANNMEVIVTIDGSNDMTVNCWMDIVEPANTGAAGYGESYFLNLGLVECLSDFKVEVTLPAAAIPTAWETNVSGWHS